MVLMSSNTIGMTHPMASIKEFLLSTQMEGGGRCLQNALSPVVLLIIFTAGSLASPHEALC